MKYEKEATTKNGRRTWKITYELVRGPAPKTAGKRKASGPSGGAVGRKESKTAAAERPKKKKSVRTTDRKQKRTVKVNESQLRLI